MGFGDLSGFAQPVPVAGHDCSGAPGAAPRNLLAGRHVWLRAKGMLRALQHWRRVEMRRTWDDLRFGARLLARTPGFTAIALITLALGIGANSTLFSLADALFLRPLPVPEPSPIVHGFQRVPMGAANRAAPTHCLWPTTSTIANTRAASLI